MNIFNFGTNLGLTGGKYLAKVIFDVKIEISVFEISHVQNFKIFWALLIGGTNLGLTGGNNIS